MKTSLAAMSLSLAFAASASDQLVCQASERSPDIYEIYQPSTRATHATLQVFSREGDKMAGIAMVSKKLGNEPSMSFFVDQIESACVLTGETTTRKFPLLEGVRPELGK